MTVTVNFTGTPLSGTEPLSVAFTLSAEISVEAQAVQPSGGFPASDPGPTKKQTRRSRIVHGIINEVAERQAKAPGLDETQKKQELTEELKLRGIEAKISYYEELERTRERLISEEIASRLRIMLEEEALAFVLLCGTVVDA